MDDIFHTSKNLDLDCNNTENLNTPAPITLLVLFTILKMYHTLLNHINLMSHVKVHGKIDEH